MGAKGERHRQCAIDCVKKGIPAGLLEDGSNKVYVLLLNKDKTSLPKEILEKIAGKVMITGKVYTAGGSQFLLLGPYLMKIDKLTWSDPDHADHDQAQQSNG